MPEVGVEPTAAKAMVAKPTRGVGLTGIAKKDDRGRALEALPGLSLDTGPNARAHASS